MRMLVMVLFGTWISGTTVAQEHHHHTDTITKKHPASSVQKERESQKQQHAGKSRPTTDSAQAVDVDHAHAHDTILMTHAYSRNLPMNRNGSGTGWVPDASPMYMYMHGNKSSNWMFHGNVVVRYNRQDVFSKGSRGDTKIDVPNWFMVMHNRVVGSRGLFNATAMLSFDPFTIGAKGYPLLFQSGETYNGNRLVDRQHPHDFVSALSVGYTYMISRDVDITAYAGYPGEPALGPTAFMHRVSALNNPDAVLGHHWQDATHVVFGVGTLGLRYKQVKLEGSVFTGREPDEKRYTFDRARFDSYSYRISYNPSPEWSLQFSQGFLHEPEILHPGVDMTRTTASAMRSQSLRTMNWSQTLVWGMNDKEHHDTKEHSILYENNLQFKKQAFYGRYEFIRKSAEELELETSFGNRIFNIHALTAGYNRNISPAAPVEILAGFQTTFNFPDRLLKPLYGSIPIGFQIYLQLRPWRHQHHK